MSFDTKLKRYCDHRIIEEDHIVDIDQRTIYLNRPTSNIANILVRVNGVKWDTLNKSEILYTEDVTSQVTGSTSIFVVSNIPIYDGANKGRLAEHNVDIVVEVEVFDEDVSEQFTGVDDFLVTQHRPLLSKYNIYATQLNASDVVVQVDSGSGFEEVEVDRVESIYGKIFLKEIPAETDIVIVTYSYKARILSFNADSGSITTRETPAAGQNVRINYYYLAKDGWIIVYNEALKIHIITFDRRKQTNIGFVTDEDVSEQFQGKVPQDYFFTEFKPIVPPRSQMNTDPTETLVTQIVVKKNGQVITARSLDAIEGKVNLGLTPETTDVITITYNYLSKNPADIVSIDYSVPPRSCKKCRSTGQLNDYDYDARGEVIIVERETKMLQDLLKMTMAIKGTNGAHPWWGTSLISYIGTAYLPEYYEVKFKGELIDAGEKIRDLQVQQAQYQTVVDEEFFSFLDNIIIEQSSEDPNFWEIESLVISQAATAIQLDTSLEFNQPLLERE